MAVLADDDRTLGARQTAQYRFAQRPGRQHPRVAETVDAVDHQQRQVFRQGTPASPQIVQGERQQSYSGGSVFGEPSNDDRMVSGVIVTGTSN
jgi:hypothetical protein